MSLAKERLTSLNFIDRKLLNDWQEPPNEDDIYIRFFNPITRLLYRHLQRW